MYTLEIGGKPIAIIASDEEDARALFESDVFKEDMKRWVSEGKPIWDGKAPFHIRPASDEEVDEFEEAEADEDEDDGGNEGEAGDDDEDEGPTVMFLIDASDPDDVEED